jgi:hypothetical protein
MNEISIDENTIIQNEENINEIADVMTNLNTILLNKASRENTGTFKTGLMKKDLAKFNNRESSNRRSVKSNHSSRSARKKAKKRRKTCFYATIVALIITIIVAGVLLFLIM